MVSCFGDKNKKCKVGEADSKWSFVVVICAMAIHFVIFGTALSFSIFLKVLMNEFNTSRSTTAWFNSIQSGIFYFSGPAVSLLLKRYNWRTLIFTGALLNGFGLSISFLAQSVYFLYASIGIFVGLGYGLIHVSAVVAVGAYFTKMNERSFAQGCSLSGGTLGTLIMPLLVYKLLGIYGFRGSFLILGGLMFQLTVFACLIAPLNPTPEPQVPVVRRKQRVGKSLPAIITPPRPDGEVDEQNDKLLLDESRIHRLDKVSEFDDGFRSLEDLPASVMANLLSVPMSGSFSGGQMVVGNMLNIRRRRLTFTAPANYEAAVEKSGNTLEAIGGHDKLKNSDLFRNTKCLVFVLMTAAWNSSVVIIMHLLFDFLLVDRALKPPINAAWISCVIMISAMLGNLLASLCGIFAQSEGSIPYDESRGFLGRLVSSKYFNCWIFNVSTLMHGMVATPLFLLSKRFDVLCLVSASFGIPLGIKMALVPTICVDLFGVQNLPFIYGYGMMASGAGILLAPPLGGYLADLTKNYILTFSLSAALSLLSFVMFTSLLIVEGRKRRNISPNVKAGPL